MLKNEADFAAVAEALELPVEDLERLHTIWEGDFLRILHRIRSRQCAFRVRLLSGSLSEYWRATRAWWDVIEAAAPQLLERPVYFVSSNPHSTVNLLTGFALHHKEELVDYLHLSENSDLLSEWKDIQGRHVPSSEENFLYYVLKKYQQTPQGSYLIDQQRLFETQRGILRIIIPPCPAQAFVLSEAGYRLSPAANPVGK